MGIDPIKEKDLVYIAIEALKAPLPEAWKPVYVERGRENATKRESGMCIIIMICLSQLSIKERVDTM